MIWGRQLIRAISNYEYTYVIDVDNLVDMTEGVAMIACLDAYLEALKAKFPEVAEPLTRQHLDTSASRDFDYNRISVVVRWDPYAVKGVYIQSLDKLFVPSWPVGPSCVRFRLPFQPDLHQSSIHQAAREHILGTSYKEYEFKGYDPEKNAWVYEEIGLTADDIMRTRVPVSRSIAQFGGRSLGKTRTMDEVREQLGLRSINSDHHHHVHVSLRGDETQELRSGEMYVWSPPEYNLSGKRFYKAKALKDLPVRESGLGIW